MRGKRLTDKEFNEMIIDERDRALTFPEDYKNIISLCYKNKLVSTIPDECKGVVLEIGTNTKREAP